MIPKLSSLTLAWSTDWATVFQADRPLILEIGFGRGVFLTHLAKTYPDHNILGVEVSNRSLEYAERAIAYHQLKNVRVVYSTGETALHHLLTPASLSQVHVNFPDPWFKTRHSHRRLMKPATLEAIVSRLQVGGTFHLATDIQEYAEMSAELLAETRGLENLLPEAWAREMSGRVTTKYEEKGIREGRTPYYFLYRRDQSPAPNVPVIKDLEMPHVVFASPLTLDEMFAQADAVKGQHNLAAATGADEAQTHINILEAYRGAEGTLLFEVHIGEPTIDQRLAIMLLPRWRANTPTQEYTLQLNTLGHPRPTDGVHKAVTILAERLLKLHPDARILNQKLRE